MSVGGVIKEGNVGKGFHPKFGYGFQSLPRVLVISASSRIMLLLPFPVHAEMLREVQSPLSTRRGMPQEVLQRGNVHCSTITQLTGWVAGRTFSLSVAMLHSIVPLVVHFAIFSSFQ